VTWTKIKIKETSTLDISLERVDEILLEHNYEQSALIAMLQDIQQEAGYLPIHVLLRLSEKLGVSVARLQALSTFYKCFSLVPTGRHRVSVCMGTACHIRGGTQILEGLERELGITSGETTPERRFTLESVRCLGCCSLAPVVRVGDKVYGSMNQRKAITVLRKHQ
jgi:NADH-quinone oxidoreductase subunit E